MTLTYTCTGADLTEARTVLGKVVTEMNRRAEIAVAARQTAWVGPDLDLTVDEMPRLAADPACRDLLTHVLKLGQKVGVTGVARGGGGSVADCGGSHVIRDLLTAGAVLRYESALTTV